MRPLVFATRNAGKVVELRALLAAAGVTRDVLSIAEAEARLGVVVPEVDEDQDTFVGNATKKAREVSRATGCPALADDSGLQVDALDGAPGVYSARYAGVDEDHDAANNAKLLRELASVANRFRSVVVLADVAGPLDDRELIADGVCEGIILEAARGTGGFGYDPLFFLPALGKTFAELGVGTKNDLSHRAHAMKLLAPRLREYLQTAP